MVADAHTIPDDMLVYCTGSEVVGNDTNQLDATLDNTGACWMPSAPDGPATY